MDESGECAAFSPQALGLDLTVDLMLADRAGTSLDLTRVGGVSPRRV
ncbi:hypothetical protein [Brevibacterium senegalense]|nr:hypothetical protein [Brevibacterium senegalense]